jgi:hypothetical protein
MHQTSKSIEYQPFTTGERKMNETIIVGMEIIAKVGRNEVEAVVIEVAETGIKAVSKKSGKEFQVKTIVQVLTPLVEANPVTEPVEIVEAPQPVEVEEVAENPIPAEERSTARPEKKKSLLTAAAEILQQTGEAFSANELIAKVQEAGLWELQAGKTPANTLYAAILREMNTKENPRFARGEKKGTFQYAL